MPRRADLASRCLDRRRQRIDRRHTGGRARTRSRSRLDPPRLDPKRRESGPRAFERACLQRRGHGRADACRPRHRPRRGCVVRPGISRLAPPGVPEELASRHRFRLVLRAFRRRVGAGSCDPVQIFAELRSRTAGNAWRNSCRWKCGSVGKRLALSEHASAAGRPRSSRISHIFIIVLPVLAMSAGSRATPKMVTPPTTCGTGPPTCSCERSTVRLAVAIRRLQVSRGATRAQLSVGGRGIQRPAFASSFVRISLLRTGCSGLARSRVSVDGSVLSAERPELVSDEVQRCSAADRDRLPDYLSASPMRRARCRERRLWMPSPPTEPATWSRSQGHRFLVVSVIAFGFSLLVLSSFVRISLSRTGCSELVRPGVGAPSSLTATFELFVGKSAP